MPPVVLGKAGVILRLSLLGRFGLVRISPGEPEQSVVITSRKGRALLAYLALHLGSTTPRSRLAELLWGDRFDKQARQSLRQCIRDLRDNLGDLGERAVVAENDTVALDPTLVEVDVLKFLEASRGSTFADLSTATTIYTGDLTTDFDVDDERFNEWLSAERTRLHLAALGVFEAYIRAAVEAGNIDPALAACERLLALDPLRETSHRLILALEATRNGRGLALTRFEKLAALLKDELRVAPEQATLDLVAAIRQGKPDVMRIAIEAIPVQEAANNGHGSVGTVIASTFALTASRSGTNWRPAAAAAILAIVIPAGMLAVSRIAPLADVYQRLAAIIGNQGSERPSPQASALSRLQEEGRYSIVVLPFTVRTEDERTRQFARALAEDLTADLSHNPQATVISHQTAIAYSATKKAVREIGRELNVNFVLTGSVALENERATVRIQLADTSTGAQIWSERFERADSARFDVYEEIIHSIGRQLVVGLTITEGRKYWHAEQRDLAIGELILRAKSLYFQSLAGDPNPEVEAINEEILRKKPDSVTAMIGLAQYLLYLGSLMGRFAPDDPEANLARADELIRRALELSPQSSAAQYFHGIIRRGQGRYDESIAAFKQTIASNPSFAAAYAQLGFGMIFIGNPEATEPYVRKALRLSPRDPARSIWLRFAGEAAIFLGQYDQAIAWLKQALEANPKNARVFAYLGAAYALNGEEAKATKAIEELLRVAPNFRRESFRNRVSRSLSPRYIEQHERLIRSFEAAFSTTAQLKQ